PQVKLGGGAGLQRDQSWRLDSVRVASEGITLDISGRGRERSGELDLALALPKLALVQGELGGSATAKGKLVLKPAGGDLHLTADLAGLSRGNVSSRNLALATDLALEGEALSGSLKANGDLANQPLTLDGRFARKADGSLLVPALSGGWASAAIDFKDLAVTPTGATGSGHLRMARLEDLAPLVGPRRGGATDLKVATEPNAAGKVKIAWRGERWRSGDRGAGDLQIDATLTDPLGVGIVDSTIKATRLAGVAEVSQVN